MNPFYENPFVEGALRFYFGESDCGATRYEKWDAHIHDF